MLSVNPANLLPYSDAVESIPPDEASDIEQVVHTIEQILHKSHQPLPDVHAKGHGCAVGIFEVLPGSPANSRKASFGGLSPLMLSCGFQMPRETC